MNEKFQLQIEKLLDQMTVAEKIAQISSFWIFELQSLGELDMQKVDQKLSNGIGQITRAAGASKQNPVQVARTANQLQHFLVQQTRLGIPAIIHEECCSGLLALGATIFPQMIGLASTFQPELAEKMTTEIRKQMLAIGARQGLAPVLDVARDPRWGRVEETFGEDPLVVSQFGVNYIRGLQNNSLHDGILATGKHFVGHSLPQAGLNCAPVEIGKQTLWDIYLMPFQAAIQKAGLASMMNAYPELNGEVVAASREIMTDLLREKLGFTGLVVSDYEAIKMIQTYHKVARNETEAAVMALRAGIDVELPTIQCLTENFIHALEAGEIEMDLVDTAVSRHLQKKMELGLFENPFVNEDKVGEVFETTGQRQLAREIARKSMVLLSNDGLLPLSKTIQSIAVIGPNADSDRNLLGDYTYPPMNSLLIHTHPGDSNIIDTNPGRSESDQARVVTVLEAIRASVPGVKVNYAQGCEVNSMDTNNFAEAIRVANNSDTVILVLGDKSGLTPDCTCGETRDSADLRLPGVQADLARVILGTGKPTVIVLINGRPLAIPDLAGSANALLEAWLPGEEGGFAIAEALFGVVNPGGKLATTFPRSVGQVPIFYNHKPSGSTSNFYTDYVSESVKPLFPFGHGLSYSEFLYKNLLISRAEAQTGDIVDISCTITNTSQQTGEEVVQLYCHDIYASLPRPVKELKGFIRVSMLPGETRKVTFHLPVDILAFYDGQLNLVVEPGEIDLMIGSSSEDIRLKGKVEIIGQTKTVINDRIYTCPVDVL
jgi:beta-glucosidase